MAHLTDLSIPVRHGEGRLGLEVEFTTPYSYETCNWQGSSFSMFCHYATHVDAPNHFIAGGAGIDAVPLPRLMGPASLIALEDHGAAKGISADTLQKRGAHMRKDDIVILRTLWSDRHWGSATFWQDGPYLEASAADWLVERGAKAVVYDFSEEYVVRQPGFRGEDCVVHHRILGNDIYNIEYVHRLDRIRSERLALLALPLKLHGLDGAPARVVALEGIDLPADFTVGA